MKASDDYLTGWHFPDAVIRQHFSRQALLFLSTLNDRVIELEGVAAPGECRPDALIGIYENLHRSYHLRYWAYESIADLIRRDSVGLDEGITIARAALKVALYLFYKRSDAALERLREARRQFAELLPRCDHQILIAHDTLTPVICIQDEYSWLCRTYSDRNDPVLGAYWPALEAPTVPATNSNVPVETPSHSSIVSTQIRLTRSQSDCAEVLRSYWLAQQQGAAVGGYHLRPPLIAARSGCGKSRLVQWLADSMKLPLLTLDVGSWLLSGSRSEKNTLTLLRDFHENHSHGIVFLDELDKAVGNDAGWWQGVNLEIMGFVDGRLNWPAELVTKKRAGFMTIGAGTWQSVHGSTMRPLGFNQCSPVTDMSRAIEADFGSHRRAIPQELGFRFDPPLLLEPPQADEFEERIASIRKDAGLSVMAPKALAVLVQDALESNRGQRWLEHYASRVMRERCLAEEREGWLHF